jgi:hypothetical protein
MATVVQNLHAGGQKAKVKPTGCRSFLQYLDLGHAAYSYRLLAWKGYG